MVSENVLKAELRRALDEALPPVPWLESRVSEDLRRKRPKAATRRLPWGLSTRSMQLAAAVLIVAIGVAAFVALHRPAPEPAGSLTVHDYQALIARDVNRWDSAPVPGYLCIDLQSPCEAPGHPVLTALQTWLSDLNKVTPPDRFALIDMQLRRHLAAVIFDMKTEFAAYRAKDQSAFDRSRNAFNPQADWVSQVSNAIVLSRLATIAEYLADPELGQPPAGACADCNVLITNRDSSCAQIQDPSCQIDIGLGIYTIGNLQSRLIRYTAPSGFATRDEKLQADLAQADTGLDEMSNAGLTNDPAEFAAGLALLQRALPAINADVAAIRGNT